MSLRLAKADAAFTSDRLASELMSLCATRGLWAGDQTCFFSEVVGSGAAVRRYGGAPPRAGLLGIAARALGGGGAGQQISACLIQAVAVMVLGSNGGGGSGRQIKRFVASGSGGGGAGREINGGLIRAAAGVVLEGK
eukprot:362283-Chlamydomonas_euryale.AAC.1